MNRVDQKFLRVIGPNFVAGAIWSRTNRKNHDHWFVSQTAPILLWMHGLSPAQTKTQLLKRRCTYEWI